MMAMNAGGSGEGQWDPDGSRADHVQNTGRAWQVTLVPVPMLKRRGYSMWAVCLPACLPPTLQLP
jgi:hypothetical protein